LATRLCLVYKVVNPTDSGAVAQIKRIVTLIPVSETNRN
jgi:hypothetical protein